jgi:hypothetical protein
VARKKKKLLSQMFFVEWREKTKEWLEVLGPPRWLG